MCEYPEDVHHHVSADWAALKAKILLDAKLDVGGPQIVVPSPGAGVGYVCRLCGQAGDTFWDGSTNISAPPIVSVTPISIVVCMKCYDPDIHLLESATGSQHVLDFWAGVYR